MDLSVYSYKLKISLTILKNWFGDYQTPRVVNKLYVVSGWYKVSLQYDTDLRQHRTREWHALESNPLSTKILSIHHQVRVNTLVKYA